MALKTQWQQNAHRALRLIGRLYRWVGWAGLGGTALIALYAFFSHWNLLSQYSSDDFYTKLWKALLVASVMLVIGLFMSGMAFLVSLFIEVGSRMMENSLLQTDLLQRLVREQSNHEQASMRLMEQDSSESNLSDDLISERTNHR